MPATVANALSTQEKLIRARAAAAKLALLSSEQKNAILQAMADAIEAHAKSILCGEPERFGKLPASKAPCATACC